MEKKMCKGCPFDYCSEQSEYFQNLGCLPSPFDIMKEMNETNKNWACHDNPTKICKGVLNHVSDMNKPINVHLKKNREKSGTFIEKVDLKKELLTHKGIHY